MLTRILAAAALAAAAAPAAASAATITTDQPCYAPGSVVGFTMAGYPAGASADLYGGQDNGYLGQVTAGADGGFAGKFTAGTLGDVKRQTFSLSATTDDAAVTAATTYTLTERTVTMSPLARSRYRAPAPVWK